LSAVNEIRVLHRGFRVLEAANLHNGARLRDFVALTGLPKTTTYRILENLCSAGYLQRDDGDDRYYLTLSVRRLSDGFYDGGWVSDIARPVLERLSEKVRYPVAIATPYGAAMLLRDNTDSSSPLAPNVYSRGTELPLLTSATGKVFLAFCDEVTRRTLLDVCAQSHKSEHELARYPGLVARMLNQVRRQGYAFGKGARKTRVAVSTATFAVPIRAGDQLIGCLALRYLSEQLTNQNVVARYLQIMLRHAGMIGDGVSQRAVSKS
jgi:IclR family mhp operon transcriptional activator